MSRNSKYYLLAEKNNTSMLLRNKNLFLVVLDHCFVNIWHFIIFSCCYCLRFNFRFDVSSVSIIIIIINELYEHGTALPSFVFQFIHSPEISTKRKHNKNVNNQLQLNENRIFLFFLLAVYSSDFIE